MALSDLGNPKSAQKGNSAFAQRAILGIGVGSAWNVRKFGITKRIGSIPQLREAIESIGELFQGKPVTIRTDAFAIEAVTLSKVRKMIPIYVGTSSSKRSEDGGRNC